MVIYLELNPKILPFLWNLIQKNRHLFGIESKNIAFFMELNPKK